MAQMKVRSEVTGSVLKLPTNPAYSVGECKYNNHFE